MDNLGNLTSINALPTEILAMVFEFYVESEGQENLCSVLSAVSRSWRKAALTPSLWKNVSFIAHKKFCDGYDWLEDQDILQRFSLIKNLNFSYGPSLFKWKIYSAKVFKLILLNSPNLEYFSIRANRNLRLPYYDSLHHLPDFCPKIRGIELESVICSPATKHLVFTWIVEYNVNLTCLILRYMLFTDHAPFALPKKIAELCPNMIHFECDIFCRPKLFALNEVQAGCPRMKKLSIRRNTFTVDDDCVACFPELEEFRFQPSYFEPYASNAQYDLIRVLRGSKDLRKLELIDVNFSAEIMRHLPCKHLQEFRFGSFTAPPCELYKTLCQWKDTLTVINVVCTEDTIQSLCRYIKDHGKNNLESLSLKTRHPFRIENLKKIIRQCVKLRFLSVQVRPCVLDIKIVLCNRKKIEDWLNQ